MLSKILLAVVMGVVATLVCLLIGALLVAIGLSLAVTVGSFLKDWAGVIGFLVAVWYLASGASWPNSVR